MSSFSDVIITKWENFCDNPHGISYALYCCFLIGAFNGLLIQSIYNGFFNGLYYIFTWPYNGVIYGKLPNNVFWLNCFSSIIEALFFTKLFFITRNRFYYKRIINECYKKDENVGKHDDVSKDDDLSK